MKLLFKNLKHIKQLEILDISGINKLYLENEVYSGGIILLSNNLKYIPHLKELHLDGI